MNKENIQVITDREKLYDKCENMEQLFGKYYLPLLDKHYSKTYELQKENEKLYHYKTLYQSLKKQKEELRSWLEAIKTMYENEYKDVDTAEHYNSVLSKLNELENKDE